VVRSLVWIGLLVAVPVPLVLVGQGSMPAGVMLELAAVTGALGVLERADGTVLTLMVLLIAQALAWAAVLGGAAVLLVRALGRAALWMVVALAVVATVAPVYRSPFHATRARQTLLEVYR
jgi:hypothetical protein